MSSDVQAEQAGGRFLRRFGRGSHKWLGKAIPRGLTRGCAHLIQWWLDAEKPKRKNSARWCQCNAGMRPRNRHCSCCHLRCSRRLRVGTAGGRREESPILSPENDIGLERQLSVGGAREQSPQRPHRPRMYSRCTLNGHHSVETNNRACSGHLHRRPCAGPPLLQTRSSPRLQVHLCASESLPCRRSRSRFWNSWCILDKPEHYGMSYPRTYGRRWRSSPGRISLFLLYSFRSCTTASSDGSWRNCGQEQPSLARMLEWAGQIMPGC